MSTSVGGVHVDLGLNSAKFESGLKKTGSELDRFGAKTKGAAALVTSSMAKAGAAFAKSFAAPLLALGAAGVVREAAAVARSIADVGDKARQAGMDVVAFQELGAVARANRLQIDDLSAAMRELALRGDEWIESAGKSGSAAEAFARIGYTVDELKEKLKDPSALLSEIIGKVQGLDRAAQIRIFDELFGGDGERLIRLLDDGERGIQKIIQAARDSGQVFDAELIAKANDLDRAFNDVATTVSTNLQQAIVNASWALFDFLQQFKAMEDRTTTSLESRLEGLGRDIVAKDFERRTELSNANSNPWNKGLHEGFAARLEQEIADLRAEEAKILQILQDRKTPITTPVASTPPTVPGTGNGGSGSGRSASSIVAETDAILRQIEALKWEKDAIGLTAKELAVANALRQAGAGATAEQRLEIEQLVSSTFDARAANDQLNASLEQMSQLGQDALRSFIDDLIEGKHAGEAFGNVLKNIGSQLLNMGIGALGNAIFPGFGGMGGGMPRLFDQGGYTGAGGRNQPAGVVHKGEYVFSKVATQRAGVANLEAMHRNLKGFANGGPVGISMPAIPQVATKGGDSVRFEMPITIDARGADAAGLAKVQQQLATMQAEMPGRMKQIIKERGHKWR